MASKKKVVRKVAATGRKAPGRKNLTGEASKQVQLVREAIEKHRSEQRFERFEAIPDDEIEKKLNRVNTPFISSIGWSPLPPGGSMTLGVSVFNPDPVTAFSMWVLLFVGPAFVVPDVGTALLNVDTRFNRLAGPDGGLSLTPSTSRSFNFTFRAPAGIERSDYFCNLFLMRVPFFFVGSVLDRVVIDITVR